MLGWDFFVYQLCDYCFCGDSIERNEMSLLTIFIRAGRIVKFQ